MITRRSLFALAAAAPAVPLVAKLLPSPAEPPYGALGSALDMTDMTECHYFRSPPRGFRIELNPPSETLGEWVERMRALGIPMVEVNLEPSEISDDYPLG